MDFVVIGLGLGALALLGGLALLCLVAPRWQRRARAAALPADAAYPAAKAAERHAAGQALLVAGAALLLATLGGISANLHDRAGAFLIASVATVAALGLLAWDFVYRRRHPAPPRRRAAPRAATAPAAASAQRVRRAPAGKPSAGAPSSTGGSPSPIEAEALEPVGAASASARAGLDTADAAVPEIPVEPGAATPAEAPVANGAPERVAHRSPEPEGVVASSRDLDADAPGAEATEASAATAAEPDTAPVSQASQPAPARIIDITARNGRQAGPAPATTRQPEFAPATAPVEPVPPAPAPAADGVAPEPDAGDDRVLALFPTAAARRERPTPPPDDDGER